MSVTHPDLMKLPSLLSALVALCMTCFLSGCSNEVASPAEVAGIYKFEHADGRVEIWDIGSNFKFDQRFYQTVADYKQSRPFLVYQNDWVFESGTALPALAFQRSYTIYNYGGKLAHKVPIIVTGVSAVWLKAEKGLPDSLGFFIDDGYLALRLSILHQLSSNRYLLTLSAPDIADHELPRFLTAPEVTLDF